MALAMEFGWRRVSSGAGTVPPPPPVEPDGYDVIVLAGQSNMVGRNGPIDPVLDAVDPLIMMYGFDGQAIVPAADPLDHQDETAGTIGMGLSFAKAYVASGALAAGRKVLLVPVAKGATAFGSGFWRAGGGGDAAAIARTNAAMTKGSGSNVLIALLWHQGEGDMTMTAAQYAADLDALVTRWRGAMTGASSLTPFICGQPVIGGAQTAQAIVDALAGLPGRLPHTAFVPSTGLAAGSDNLHFTAAAQRALGQRYHDGLASARANALAPVAPSQPLNLVATAGSGQVSLTWNAPATAQPAVTDYVVEYKASAASGWTVLADGVSAATGADVPGLTNATAYDFRVKAVNSAGEGPYSAVASATPVAPASVAEATALRHWLFGSDNPGYLDMLAGEGMVPAGGPATTLNSGYVTTGGTTAARLGGMRAAATGDLPAMTMIVVARALSAAVAGNGALFAGNFDASGASGGGLMIGHNGTNSPARAVMFNLRGGANNTAIAPDGTIVLGDWHFYALSISTGVSRLDYIGAASGAITSSPANGFTRSVPGNRISIGDGYYNSNANNSFGADIAELIIFDRALTKIELDGVYARSVARLAARGLTL